MNGICLPCDSVQWSALCGVLFLFLLLIYAIHRLPHDWSGAATMTCIGYFMQQSALFLSFGSTFQLFSLVNFDLIGDSTRPIGGQEATAGQQLHHLTWCVVPMGGDAQRLVGSLVSLPIAFLLLCCIAGMQGVARVALSQWDVGSTPRTIYAFVFLSAPSPRPTITAAPVDLPHELSMQGMVMEPLHYTDEDEAEGEGQGEGDSDDDSAEPSPSALCLIKEALVTRFRRVVLVPSWLAYQRTCVRLVLLSYTGLALLTIRFFHSRTVGGYGARPVDYPGLSTESSEYLLLFPVMTCCLVLVCLLPVLLAVYLLRKHRQGTIAELRSRPDLAVAAASGREAALILQLCCMFKGSYWWMAPFISVRRLLLVALFVFTPSTATWVWLTFANSLLLAIHLQLRPYERPQDNTLESVGLLSLCIQTTLLCAWPRPYGNDAVLAALNTLVLGPPLLVGGLLCLKVWNRRKEMMKEKMRRKSIDE